MSNPRPISGKTLLAALGAAGIITDADKVRRVVIDAPINDTVSIYVERYGDERLLSVVTSLDGVKIETRISTLSCPGCGSTDRVVRGLVGCGLPCDYLWHVRTAGERA